jgi:hypothetical protein
MGKYTAPVEDHLILPAVASLTARPAHLLRLAGQPVPAPIAIRLLIDTGSKRTTLVPGVVRQLNLAGAIG